MPEPISDHAQKRCVKAMEIVAKSLQFDPSSQLQNNELKPAHGDVDGNEDFPWLVKSKPVDDKPVDDSLRAHPNEIPYA